MAENTSILFGVGAYLVLMLVIGIVAARRANSAEGFMVAGRNLPTWICTGTILATWMGAVTIVGAGGAAYSDGLLGVIADPFGAVLALFLGGMFIMRITRRLKLITVIDFIEAKYNPTAGILAGIGMLIAYTGWAASQFVAFGIILNTLTGIDTETGIYVGALVVLIYTTAGGMWAVALTDVVQMFFITIGLIILLPLAMEAVGGWNALTAGLPEGTFRMIPVEHTGGAWFSYLRDWAVIGIGSLAAQDYLQRAFSSRNERVAQNSSYLAALGYLTLGMIPVILGLIGTQLMPGVADPESVVPLLAMDLLPPLLMTIFLSALLAAIMSSADSALLATASIASSNLLPMISDDVDDKRRLSWARWSIPIVGVLALFVGLEVQAVFRLAVDALAVLLVVVVVPVVAGIWWRSANTTGAVAAMVTGYVVWIGLPFLVDTNASDFIGFLAGAIVMGIVTPLTQKSDPPKPVRDGEGNIVVMENRLGVLGFVKG